MREGARWHVIEPERGRYDFGSLEPILEAAESTGTQIILDLFHFGWPDHLEIFSDEFVPAFSRFTKRLISMLRARGWSRPFLAPVNEISFMAWAGGDEGFVNPFARKRGHEMKKRLIEAAIHASRIILDLLPGTRLVSPEPVIHIIGNHEIPGDDIEAEHYRTAQFECWDMLSGRLHPELGGRPEYLDIIGVNFYDRNQWVHNSKVSLDRDDPRYRPFREILNEVWQRYGRPIFVSETGTEDDARPGWFEYVCREVKAALAAGIPMKGICLYPIVNHPGWEDDRHCRNGLFDYADDWGNRAVYEPLAGVIRKQTSIYSATSTNLKGLRQANLL